PPEASNIQIPSARAMRNPWQFLTDATDPHRAVLSGRPGCTQLQHRLETFELRMAQGKRFAPAGARMGGTKGFGLGPRLEIGFGLPDRVRRVEHMVFCRRSLQQV